MNFNCFLLSLLVLISACSSSAPEGKTEAEVLYKEAERLMERKRYLLAIEKLNELKSHHPYSYYAVPSELKLADIYFLQKNYIEAAGAYLLFRDMHPKHERIDYVIYKIAESYFKQLPPTHDRDLSVGLQAIQYYEELMRLYPNTQYADEAKANFAEIQKLLAQKEQYIADYYFKVKNYEAASHRYRAILADFAENENLIRHSQMRLILSSVEQEAYEDCLMYIREFAENLSSQLKRLEGLTDQCEAGVSKSVEESQESV